MIFGDPGKFAVSISLVSHWSNPSSLEGVFGIYINGRYFPQELDVRVSSIYEDVRDLSFGPLKKMPIIHSEYYNLPTIDLYTFLLKRRHPSFVFDSLEDYEEYPDDLYEDEDFEFDASTETLRWSRLQMFAISNTFETKILISSIDLLEAYFFSINELKEREIIEATINKEDLFEIITAVETWYSESWTAHIKS